MKTEKGFRTKDLTKKAAGGEITPTQAAEAVDRYLSLIAEKLTAGEHVVLSHIGTLRPRVRESVLRHNPRKGLKQQTKASIYLSLNTNKGLDAALQKNFDTISARLQERARVKSRKVPG